YFKRILPKIGFLFMAWMTHYLPFYFMPRINLSVGDVLKLEHGGLSSLQHVSLGRTHSSGSAEVRRILATTYLKLNSEQILIHSGSGEAILNFAQSVMNMGDQVIVQWPCYQSLYQCFIQRGCIVQLWTPTLVEHPATENKRSRKMWSFELETLKKLLKMVPRLSGSQSITSVVINDPHNPTGFGFSREQMFDLVDICKLHDAYLFSDEVYRELYFDKLNESDSQPPAVCDIYEKGISVGSMSKQFGMGGLRLGWIATSNTHVLNAMKLFKDYLSYSVSAPSEILAIITLRHRLSIMKSNTRIIKDNLQKATNFFAANQDIFSFVPARAGPLFLATINPTAHDAVLAVYRKSGLKEPNDTSPHRSASTQSLSSLTTQTITAPILIDMFCDLCLSKEGLLVVPMSTMKFIPTRIPRGSFNSLSAPNIPVDKNAWIQDWFRVGVGRKNWSEALAALGRLASEIRKQLD
ncbi:hypothetical protein HK096_004667, partial [Nowakowskiella sp. JEL0078]